MVWSGGGIPGGGGRLGKSKEKQSYPTGTKATDGAEELMLHMVLAKI